MARTVRPMCLVQRSTCRACRIITIAKSAGCSSKYAYGTRTCDRTRIVKDIKTDSCSRCVPVRDDPRPPSRSVIGIALGRRRQHKTTLTVGARPCRVS